MTVTGQSRKAAFRRAVEIWQDGRTDLISNVVTDDYVGHTSAGDRNIDGLRQRISEFHALYPDMRFTIEDQLAEGDRIATRMTALGTSKATGHRRSFDRYEYQPFRGQPHRGRVGGLGAASDQAMTVRFPPKPAVRFLPIADIRSTGEDGSGTR